MYRKINKPEEEILMNDLYRNNQYYFLLSRINEELTKLGLQEIKITQDWLLEMYEKSAALAADSIGFQVPLASGTDVINRIWCADGKNWSDRVWTNKKLMQQRLEECITNCVSRGLNKEKVISEIAGICNVSRGKAERLVRTELTHVQNEASADTYQKAGCTEYEYLCETGNEEPDECDELNGQVFRFADKQIGVNFPPMHCNCRCTILPVVKR